MPKTKLHLVSEPLSEMPLIKGQDENDPKYVKIVVFDDHNRALVVKKKNRFVLPGGRVEWDDDDAEAAVRREVFETANIALGLVIPVTLVRTKDRNKQITKTMVFVGRMSGEEQAASNQEQKHRFFSKEAFLEATGHRNDLVRTLVDAAFKVLVSEEIKEDHDQTTLSGREKYNSQSLL